MYLKRLESVGFKSFAERINIAFVPGVTAVVGPNGSGKSNITDAIRWVLGEQSVKSLRGAKMEDVIFQGSDTRKPLNFAEVTLVLDNSSQSLPIDYEEINVTRRVYRSGVSEFYMNKQSCRLKDIIDLFMDSGLGQDSFSIISQGRVEEVLSSKAEERRIIFEEAAGVLKYKQRKRKAEYKLAETQENLNRVDDIIYEIDQQINPLKEQSEVATEYLRQMERLKEHEISLLITEIELLHKEWQTLLDELDEEKMREIQLKTEIQKKEAHLEVRRGDIQALDDQIETLQEKLLAMTQQVEQYEGKKQVLHERIKHFAKNKEKLVQQKHDTQSQLDKLHQSLEIEQAIYKELLATKQNTHEKINSFKQKLTTDQDELLEKIEGLKSEYIEYLNQQAAHRNEKQSIQQQLKQLKGKKSSQSERIHQLLVQKEDMEKQQHYLSEAFSKQEQNYLENKETIQNLKKRLSEERNQFNVAQENLYKGFQTITRLTSRKEMLEEMKDDFQGFFHGVKAVLQANKQKQLNGIHGAVIECIDVPKQYITAIETVLGGQAQHIVVEDDFTARETIKWLKQTKKGRATFLPLASIQPRSLAPAVIDKIESLPGFIGIASHLVHTSDTYAKVVHHLMGHVIIARTLKEANELAVLTKRRHRIVTLDGDVVNPGGSMSGGAKKNTNQSLFTRDKDLQELTKKLADYEYKAKALEQKVDKQNQTIEQSEVELEEKEQSIISEQQELQRTNAAYKKVEMELEALNDTFTFHEQDQEQFAQERQSLIANDEHLQGVLTTIHEHLMTTQKEIDKLTMQATELKENQAQIQRDLHRHQISFAEQEERVRNQNEKIMAIQKQFETVENQYEDYSNDLSELIRIQQDEITTEALEQDIQNKRKLTDDLTNDIQKLRTKRLQETQSLQDEELALKEENKQHYALIGVIQKQEVKTARLDADLENRLSTLQNDYTITFERACETYDQTTNIEETKYNVNKLKQSIETLGAVNLGSIDEYNRISERYTFLTEQKTDLIVAKETLYSIISEMDNVMKERFEKTFSKIKDEFTVVFKELFGGGHASLTLTDPNNILDTGIEINAQPPGKNLQHIGLLSGGERALTAISLLFSILRVRPVPFCVLDEVEAALDEANVVRFAKYVKLHSDETQFIVITHRKGTMEEADVLYGVTMQESGVSRLVSVQLEDTVELVNS